MTEIDPRRGFCEFYVTEFTYDVRIFGVRDSKHEGNAFGDCEIARNAFRVNFVCDLAISQKKRKICYVADDFPRKL